MSKAEGARTTVKLTLPKADIQLLDGLGFHIGSTRAQLITAALRQMLHRYLLGVSDPILPVGSVAYGRRVVPDVEEHLRQVEKYNEPESAVEMLLLEMLRHEPSHAAYPTHRPRRTFDPKDPTSWQVGPGRPRKKLPLTR